MTFETAKSALAALGGKSSGELILADDWNALVTQVQAMGQALSDGLAELDDKLQGVIDGELTDLRTDLGALQSEVAELATHVGDPGSTNAANLTGRVAALEGLPNVVEELEASVAPLKEQYLVSLSTEENHYLLGEVAEITAQVRKLNGDIPANRPWVDFICTWGTVKAAPGFSSHLGASGRSVSVRSNAQGIARVSVRSEQSGALSEDEEGQLKVFFATQIGSSVKGELMEASSSVAPKAHAAYQETSRVYEMAQAEAMHKLADGYYAGKVWGYGGNWGQQWQPSTEWQEYRSTLVAIAKNDSDPTSPDPGRGTSSIQVRFRDWVGPWIGYYLAEDTAEVAVGNGYIAQAVKEQSAGAAMQTAKGLMAEGLHGEQRFLRRSKVLHAWGKAADQFDGLDLPDYGPEVTETVKAAVGFQKGMDVVQYDAAGGGEDAFHSWMGSGVRTAGAGAQMQQRIGEVQGGLDSLSGDLGGKMAALEGGFAEVNSEVRGLSGSLTNLNGRLNASEAAAQQIQTSLNGIEDKVVDIDVLDATSVQGRLSEITAELGVIKTRVGGI